MPTGDESLFGGLRGDSRKHSAADSQGGHDWAVRFRIVVLALLSLFSEATAVGAAEAKSVALQKYAKLPLSFERHGASEFVARGQGYVIDIRGPRATIAPDASRSVGIEFVHGRHSPATPGKELPGKVNYIYGNDPRQWRLGLPTYERVTYRDLYPGIDLVYYGNQKQLEFDLVLRPGAALRSIRMRFSGAGNLQVDQSGNLLLGDLRLMVPKVIQGKNTVPAKYRLLGSREVAFEVGAYDRRQRLIIDPTLVYSTRLGGGNGYSEGHAIALDASGNAYVAGQTFASDFPAVNAAFPGFQGLGTYDGFVSKINAAGTAVSYSTYFGGSDWDSLNGIAVDSTGAAWAVGQTRSSNLPVMNPYQVAFGGGSNDAVVLKLGPSGTLVFSTYLGGPGYDHATAVTVDTLGNAYVTGYADAGFPTTAGAYQTATQGRGDAFVTKFSPGGSLLYSTFVGGTGADFGTPSIHLATRMSAEQPPRLPSRMRLRAEPSQ